MSTHLTTNTSSSKEDTHNVGSIAIVLSIAGFLVVCAVAFLIEHYMHKAKIIGTD
jgi:hypothetical protein